MKVFQGMSFATEPKQKGVIPNRAESPVRNLLFSADEPECPSPAPPAAENRDGRGSFKLRWCPARKPGDDWPLFDPLILGPLRR